VLSLLDILGIILIGLLLSKSAEQISGSTASSNSINFTHFFSDLSLPVITITALVAFLGKSFLAVIFMKLMSNTLAKAESEIVKNTFNKILQNQHDQLLNFSKSELSFALTYSSSYAVTNLLAMWIIVISESALLLSIAVLFALVDIKISIGIFIYFAIIGYGIYRVLGTRMQAAGKLFRNSATTSSEIADDAIGAIRDIITLGKAQEFTKKFSKNRQGLSIASANVTFYSSLPRYIVESALIIGAVILASYVFLFSDAAAAAGILGVFLTGGLRVTASIIPLQSALATINQLIAQSEPFFKLATNSNAIELENLEIKHLNNADLPASFKFENVFYKYTDSEFYAVKDISFEVESGEYVAVIGPSGSGKSTIADLLIGLIKPVSGEISVNNPCNTNSQIGYVPQVPGIIHGTILENITLNINSEEFNAEKLENALTLSHLSELVASLRNGVNTNLGVQADSLSGGQLQRIGLARALYSNPGLLVLDEATSALDAETESAIADTLESLRGKCTMLVIAHRLTTVQKADKVYVIENGNIVAAGTFAELAKSNELVSRYIELSEFKID